VNVFVVNILGSFALGALVALIQLELIQIIRLSSLEVGFLGSFTTMITFAIKTVQSTDKSFVGKLSIEFAVKSDFFFLRSELQR